MLKAILDYHVFYKGVSAYQFPPPGTSRAYFTLDTRCVCVGEEQASKNKDNKGSGDGAVAPNPGMRSVCYSVAHTS